MRWTPFVVVLACVAATAGCMGDDVGGGAPDTLTVVGIVENELGGNRTVKANAMMHGERIEYPDTPYRCLSEGQEPHPAGKLWPDTWHVEAEETQRKECIIPHPPGDRIGGLALGMTWGREDPSGGYAEEDIFVGDEETIVVRFRITDTYTGEVEVVERR